jgi:predicted nucleotidyltransferase
MKIEILAEALTSSRLPSIDIVTRIEHISTMESVSPNIESDGLFKTVPQAALGEICSRYGVRRLSIFGSSLKGTRRPDSDVDLLAEFQPGRTPGFAFVRLAEELSRLFGMRVDLHTAGSLSRYFRREVISEAMELYVAQE